MRPRSGSATSSSSPLRGSSGTRGGLASRGSQLPCAVRLMTGPGSVGPRRLEAGGSVDDSACVRVWGLTGLPDGRSELATHDDCFTGCGTGVGILGLLFVLFVGLKLTGVIGWSWWWVTAPIWGPAVAVLVFAIIALIFAAAAASRSGSSPSQLASVRVRPCVRLRMDSTRFTKAARLFPPLPGTAATRREPPGGGAREGRGARVAPGRDGSGGGAGPGRAGARHRAARSKGRPRSSCGPSRCRAAPGAPS